MSIPACIKNYFDSNLSIVSDRQKKTDITFLFQKSIRLLDEIEESCQEYDFLLAAANITKTFNKAYNKCYLNELIEKIAHKYIKNYHQDSLSTLITTRNRLQIIEKNYQLCSDIPNGGSDSLEDREIRIMNSIAKNSKFVFDFLEKAIDIKIFTTLNEPNVKGMVHQFTNQDGGKIFIIGTLGSLEKNYISNVPNIRNSIQQSSKIFVETMPFLFSNYLNDDCISLANKKNITVQPFESKWESIKIFFSHIKASLEDSAPIPTLEDTPIKEKELVSLRIEQWQKGVWNYDDYRKTIPQKVQNLLFTTRINDWLQKTNLLEHLSHHKNTVSIVIGANNVKIFSDIFENMGFTHTQL